MLWSPPVACHESLHQIKLGLNVTLENGQMIAKCTRLAWGSIAIPLVFSVFQVLWRLCLLLVRFPPWPGSYDPCVCLHFPSPTSLNSPGGALGPALFHLLCVDNPRMMRVLMVSHFGAIQSQSSNPPYWGGKARVFRLM